MHMGMGMTVLWPEAHLKSQSAEKQQQQQKGWEEVSVGYMSCK